MPRRAITATAALVAALGLPACGGDAEPTSATAPVPGGPAGFASDPKVAACLKKQGVELPAGRRPPAATDGERPPRTQPPQGDRPRRDDAQFEKLRKALERCGVQMPQPGQGGPPGAGGDGPPVTGQTVPQ